MAYPRLSTLRCSTRFSFVGVSLALCVACGGSSFDAGGSGGDTGSGATGTGATGATAGSTSSAGTSAGGASAGSDTGGSSDGGTTGIAGGTSSGGSVSTGGTSAGGTSHGGASTGGTSSGGTGGKNTGGTSTGGASGGSGGGPDCATLKTDYAALVEKARGCDAGSTDECSPSSTMPVFGCGCPTLVNAKSTYTELAKKKYQAIQDAKCPSGPVCGIACIAITSASCSMQTTSSGSAYQCVGMSGIATN